MFFVGVKWKTKKDDFPKVLAAAETINGRKVQVGALTGKNANLAAIHEY